MWTYFQATGELVTADGEVDTGYSGHGSGRNNPGMQSVHNVGPIPRGTYSIGPVRDEEELGPCVMPLTLITGEAFGRDGFWIRGNNQQIIARSRDRRLRVVA